MRFDRAGYICQLVVSGDGGLSLWDFMKTPEPAAQLLWVYYHNTMILTFNTKMWPNKTVKITRAGADLFLITTLCKPGFTTRRVNQLIYLSACLWVGLFVYAEHILKSAVLFEIIMWVLEALQRPERPSEAKYTFMPGSTEEDTQARTRFRCIYSVY